MIQINKDFFVVETSETFDKNKFQIDGEFNFRPKINVWAYSGYYLGVIKAHSTEYDFYFDIELRTKLDCNKKYLLLKKM